MQASDPQRRYRLNRELPKAGEGINSHIIIMLCSSPRSFICRSQKVLQTLIKCCNIALKLSVIMSIFQMGKLRGQGACLEATQSRFQEDNHFKLQLCRALGLTDRVRQWDSAIPRLRETKIPADAFSLQVRKLCKNLGGFFFTKGTTRFRDRLHESFLSLPVGCHFFSSKLSKIIQVTSFIVYLGL